MRFGKWILAATAVAYSLFIILFHQSVGSLILELGRSLPPLLYWGLPGLTVLALGTWLVWRIARGVRSGAVSPMAPAYIGVSVLLIFLASELLCQVDTEVAHYVQYAILGCLLLKLSGRPADAVFYATLIGFVDEAWQYWHLYKGYPYFDINDVVLNVVGAGLGVSLHLSLAWKVPEPKRSSPVPWIVVGLGAALVTLWMTGLFRFAPHYLAEDAAIMLRRIPVDPEFWKVTDRGYVFHILRPAEGLVLTFLLIALFIPLNYVRRAPVPAPARVMKETPSGRLVAVS